MFKHVHRSWFPALVVLLSVALALFVIWSYLAREEELQIMPAVTAEQYQGAVGAMMRDFWNQYNAQESGTARLALVSEIEQSLLALRVPAESRSVHFALVSGLELLKQGLAGDSESLLKGAERLQEVFSENLWLSE